MPNKVCPKCSKAVHVRRLTCSCGNSFSKEPTAKKKIPEETFPLEDLEHFHYAKDTRDGITIFSKLFGIVKYSAVINSSGKIIGVSLLS